MITQSTKIFDGFSTCFRQWRATDTHCKFLHSYNTWFEVTFEGELDERNWVMDYGRAKRSPTTIQNKSLKEYLNWLLDHTLVVAEDDPALSSFKDLDKQGVVQLRILPQVGTERFAEHLFRVINDWAFRDTDGRVKVVKLQFWENHKNSAIVIENEQNRS